MQSSKPRITSATNKTGKLPASNSRMVGKTPLTIKEPSNELPNAQKTSKVNTTTKVSEKRFTATKFDPHKQANILSTDKRNHKTNFSAAYLQGQIPCRISHGSSKLYLQWDIPPKELNYDPLLVTCLEGILETEHPYVFVSRTAFRELLRVEDAVMKTLPLLSRLIPTLRIALRSSNKDIFLAAVEHLKCLSDVVTADLNEYLTVLLPALNQKIFDKSCSTAVQACLQALDTNGGDKAYQIMKTKIPTYIRI